MRIHSFGFFGSISIHLSQALLAHLFSFNITWGATRKEVDHSNLFIEVPRIMRRFWLAHLLGFLAILMMIILSSNLLPLEWRISGGNAWAAILPLALVSGCHMLFPFMLNPWFIKYLIEDPPYDLFSLIFKSIVSRRR